MESITVSAKPEVLDSVVEFITARLTRCGCSEDVQLEVRLAVEEIFVNITSYAYHPQDGEAEIRCDVLEDPLRVVIQILDSGRPFDPLARERADTSEEALIARDGGLGILLVCSTMDNVSYSYENGRNILTILKKL